MGLRSRLATGGTVFGVISPIAHPSIVELTAISNFDFYLLDGELGALSPATSEAAILAARMVGITLIVRLPRNEPSIINHYLDLGASGIVVPHVSTVEAAKRAKSAARYYPDGYRGLGPCRANDYAIKASLLEYTRIANQQTFVMVQIEDAQAVKNCDDIASVDGIDAILVGPRDLALSMGCLDARDKRTLDKAIDHVIATSQIRGVPVCLPAAGPTEAVAAAQRGAQMILVPLLSLLYQGMSRFLESKER